MFSRKRLHFFSSYNILAENNIEIPFPQVDLHVKNLPTENKAESKDDNLKSVK